jgi:Leucine-rich repeat (LRR) protein
MERVQLVKAAILLTAPFLILGVVDKAVNALFFKVFKSRALTSDSLRFANTITKVVLGTVVMGVAAVQNPDRFISLPLLIAVSASMVYLCSIPVYFLYAAKEGENNARASRLDRVTPSDFNLKVQQNPSGTTPQSLPLPERPNRTSKNLEPDYHTLQLWENLAEAINIPYNCFYNSEYPKKYDSFLEQFNAWINQNKLLLRTVTTLDLKNVDCTNLELRLNQFPNLENLNLNSSKGSTHFLSETPPLLGQLKTLNLASTGLTDFPSVVSKCSKLLELDISFNQITALPEASKLPTTLKVLNVSNNRLTIFPSLDSQCPNLEKLNISFNQITALPEASKLPTTLKVLNVSNNRLTTLPDSVLQMPSECSIEAEGNFTFEDLFAFIGRILEIRNDTLSRHGVNLQGSAADAWRIIRWIAETRNLSTVESVVASIRRSSDVEAENSLEATLVFWLTEFQTTFPNLCKDKSDRLPGAGRNQKDCPPFYNQLLKHPEHGKLSLFLKQLQASKDYTDSKTSRIQLIRRVYNMLELAATSAPFCEILFPLLEDACSTCHDRPALVFNQIEMQMELLTTGEKDDNALVKLCIGLKRVELLRKCADKRITTLNLPDPVEVFLFYETRLREELQLPVSTEKMIFENYASISPQVLREDAQQVLEKTCSPNDIYEILLEQGVWHDRMKETHPLAFKEQEEDFEKRMGALSESTSLKDGEKEIAMRTLMNARERASQRFVEQRTLRWIQANPKCAT